MTVAVMKLSLTRAEYFKWISYYQNKNPEIQEIQLAVISSMIARGLGSKDSSADDFIISKMSKNTSPDTPMDTEAVSNFFQAML